MVQGWQRRAELAVARREESKQKKHEKSNRADVKNRVVQLLSKLDQIPYRKGTWHIWSLVDRQDATMNNPPENDTDEFTDIIEEKVKRPGFLPKHNRKISTSGQPPLSPAIARSSPAATPKASKKHQASKSSSSSPRNKCSDITTLCRMHFYYGQCEAISRTGSKSLLGTSSSTLSSLCRHHHLASPSLTDTLGKDQAKNAEFAMIDASREDVAAVNTNSVIGGMEMMQYVTVTLSDEPPSNCQSLKSEQKDVSMGQVLSQFLRDKSCHHARIVYIAFDNMLLLDRYRRDGLPEWEHHFTKIPNLMRKTSLINNGSPAIGENVVTAVVLPVVVLEYILTFLPEIAFANMVRVCRAWNEEIGTSSNHIWWDYLHRRKWPLCVTPSADDKITKATDTQLSAKESFKSHYQVVRDVRAVRHAISMLLSPKRSTTSIISEDQEVVCQVFSQRRTAPAKPNTCVSVHIWSPVALLAAYSYDCTVRLFHASEKINLSTSSASRSCREIMSICINPYRNTTRRKAELVAIQLDKDLIGCLLFGYEGGTSSRNRSHIKVPEHFLLCLVSRDAYLEAAGGDSSALGWSELEKGTLHVLNICDELQKFWKTSYDREQDASIQELLSEDGAFEADVRIQVSPHLVACGSGCFCVEVCTFLPADVDNVDVEDDDDLDDVPMTEWRRDLVLFHSNSVIAVRNVNSIPAPFPNGSNVFWTGSWSQKEGSAGNFCRIVGVSSSSPTIAVMDVERGNQDCHIEHLNEAHNVRAQILSSISTDGWEIDTDTQRLLVVMENHEIVACDVFVQNLGDQGYDYRSILSFYSIEALDIEAQQDILHFESCRIWSIQRLREEYILIFCDEVVTVEGTENELDNIVGQWFTEPTPLSIVVHAIVLHVPTRHIMDRTQLFGTATTPSTTSTAVATRGEWKQQQLQYPSLQIACGYRHTLGVGWCWMGVILTGANIREKERCANEDSSRANDDDAAARKKKKVVARQIYSRKKEGRRAPRCSS